MKAVTLYNPWAHFMALEYKKFETRGRRITYRGPLCIHAGLYQPIIEEHLRTAMKARGLDPDEKHPGGVIVAVVDLYDCIRTLDAIEQAKANLELEFGNYQPNRFAWLTRGLRRLKHPVMCAGKQATPWDVPPGPAAEVQAQLDHGA